jgi:hypothetical protein
MKDALPLTAEEVRRMNAYWRAANYLSVGQIYLYDNPLLREPLKIDYEYRGCPKCVPNEVGTMNRVLEVS